MDNKKLVLKDISGNEYVFISKKCDNSSFNFSSPDQIMSSRFSYEYRNIDEEVYNFYNTIKNIELSEVFFYMTVEDPYTKEMTEIQIFSSTSKNLKISNIRYNETSTTKDVNEGYLKDTLMICNLTVEYK